MVELFDELGFPGGGLVDPHAGIVAAEFGHGPFVLGHIIEAVVSSEDEVLHALGIFDIGVGGDLGDRILLQVTGTQDEGGCGDAEYNFFHIRQNLMSTPRVTVEVSGNPPRW